MALPPWISDHSDQLLFRQFLQALVGVLNLFRVALCRIPFQELLVGTYCLLLLAEFILSQRPVVPCIHVARVKLQDLIVVVNGSFVLPQSFTRSSNLIPSNWKVWVKLQRFVTTVDGIFVTTQDMEAAH